MNAKDLPRARAAARRFAERWSETYPNAVACLRNDLDELLACFRYKTLAERRTVRTTNAIERRFREVRRRTRPMGTFSDRTSMDRILFAVFTNENRNQGVSTPRPSLTMLERRRSLIRVGGRRRSSAPSSRKPGGMGIRS
jgi:transposase-like protein